jgi:ribosomal protein L35
MKLADKKKSEDFYKLFKPQLSPQKMLEMGVFGGSYFGNKINEYPKSWFKNAKLSKTFDIEKNRFKVRAGLSRKEWIDKGWIFKEDPLGWFQWYCRFKNGRRIRRIDEVQIKRWKAFKRHVAAIKKNCEPGNIHCRRKQRQAILQWAYNSSI